LLYPPHATAPGIATFIRTRKKKTRHLDGFSATQ
jgi:hypothetical protein